MSRGSKSENSKIYGRRFKAEVYFGYKFSCIDQDIISALLNRTQLKKNANV